jgi:hypothetical protein
MRKFAKILGYLVSGVTALAAIAIVAAVVRGSWKYQDEITVSADAVVDPCEEGCDWFRITAVDNPRYSFVRGWLIDGEEGRGFASNIPSYKYIDSVMGVGRQNGYSSYCLTGKLHRYQQRFLLFWSRGEVHEFTVESIKWGDCPGRQPT